MHRIEGLEKLVWVLTGGVSDDPAKYTEPATGEGFCATCGEELGTIYAGAECMA